MALSRSLLHAFTIGLLVQVSFAAPLVSRKSSSDKPTPINNATIASTLLRPALFSRVAYCPLDAVEKWECGEACKAVGKVDILKVGGDDGRIPSYFVAHDPTTKSIVVSHQGTDPSNILSIWNDAQFSKSDLNTTAIPAAEGRNIQVHDGFQDTFTRTADIIFAQVKAGLAKYKATNVLVTGHSLGAAVATMDAMMLRARLDASVKLTTIVFGLPRVGDQAWADLLDSKIGSTFHRVSNQHDPVINVPPQFLDFVHPSKEVHIKAVNKAGQATNVLACPGQENKHCAASNSILEDDVDNHSGPYFENISFGASQCKT